MDSACFQYGVGYYGAITAPIQRSPKKKFTHCFVNVASVCGQQGTQRHKVDKLRLALRKAAELRKVAAFLRHKESRLRREGLRHEGAASKTQLLYLLFSLLKINLHYKTQYN